MTDDAVVEATFVDHQPVRSRGVVKLIFEVPETRFDFALAALGGHPLSSETRWCALARLDPALMAKRASSPPAPSADAKGEKRAATLAFQAKSLCADFRFQRWLGVDSEDRAAAEVRELCRVASRGEFDRSPEAGARWSELRGRYRRETGLEPEQRGPR